MPAEVTVGPPVLTINQGTTFMVTDQRGEIDPESVQGVFRCDTRFVSHYRLYVNGVPWQLLTSAAIHYYAAEMQLASPQIKTDQGEIRAHDLGLKVLRRVDGGIHEDLDLTSYAPRPVCCQLEIELRSDFADIFEVRSGQLVRRGEMTTVWDDVRCELVNAYANGDFRRRFVFRITNTSSRPRFANGRVTFDLALQPGESWHACASYILIEGDRAHEPPDGCEAPHGSGVELGHLQAQWLAAATRFDTASEDVDRALLRSVKDLGALRMRDPDLPPDVWVPAAGVPRYVALFGRDSLLVSLQTLPVHPSFARGTLEKLARYQATELDDWRDAEPGKILHELRVGELAHFRRLPHTPYYGSADATPLYLIALHEAWKWLGDAALLRRYREVALRCLEWIDHSGDLDGDGLQEYATRSPQGYENQGWKDSWDAIVYPDGTPVPQPKALCELQGYAFDAKLRLGEVFEALGEPERACALRRQAAELQRRFEEAFWCEDLGFYALGLDPEKRPIRTIASNAGHCLWSGIVRPERAARVVRRFFEPDLWSGWGIRTLSARHPAYNPFSYHRGSVWPHDNGLIALGFKRYGFAEEAAQVAQDVFQAASHFQRYRIPELYAGLPRPPGAFPIQYLGANVPQAWAAGSLFHLIQALLGLRADAPSRCLYVDPTLPAWLPEVRLEGLAVGGTRLALRFWREDGRNRWEVVAQQGGPEIAVREEAWRPWELPAEPPTDSEPRRPGRRSRRDSLVA